MPKPKGSKTLLFLVTWEDMLQEILRHWIAKAQTKEGTTLHHVNLGRDNNLVKFELRTKVNRASKTPGCYVKITVSGHGEVGTDAIYANNQKDKKTIKDLVEILGDALGGRAKKEEDAAKTEVSMISCLLGRSVGASPNTSSASRLHRGLIEKGVYVTLYAYTEIMVTEPQGEKVETRLHDAFLKKRSEYNSTDRQLFKLYRKHPYTKVVFTCKNGASVARLHAYEDGAPEGGYLEDSREGRQLLWADWVIDCIVDTIRKKVHEDRVGNLKTPLEVKEKDHILLQMYGEEYCISKPRRPSKLRERLMQFHSILGRQDKTTTARMVENWIEHYPM